MINILHSLAMIIGGLSYYFSDVNSHNTFNNTLLPFIALLSFIYGVIVTVNMLYNMRKKPHRAANASDILFESIKELKHKKSTSGDIIPEAKQTAPIDDASLSTEKNYFKTD